MDHSSVFAGFFLVPHYPLASQLSFFDHCLENVTAIYLSDSSLT